MENISKKKVKKICQDIGLRPRRQSGQHFLYKKEIINQIIGTSQPLINESILEIGPGLGFLTEEILKKSKKLLAVEIDKRMAEYLKNKFQGENKLKIIRENIFDVNLKKYFNDLNYKLISNLPYNITSLVLRNFLSEKPRPKEMILTIQKEVALRIIAKPPNMSILSVVCQFYAQPKIIKIINPDSFWPRPKVDSAVIKFYSIGENKREVNEENFLKVVKGGFSAKRKKLTNNLKHVLGILPNNSQKILKDLGIKKDIRAQNLTLEDWVALSKKLFDV
ncbi:MAG: 16S rRNA (adenine(1518)-N(6)/adenine(1519)-N(6))-dimethyltransferase RsmA [Patescibacteria group bacterium]|nr:16S rRNA (adenine(1518)-N(6)/adenine(1519)-N(6))-dimethyltransferase RsmA [Patescibacteria group bacterium]